MTKYNLMYFDFKGRAETIRFIFHVAGVEYTDTRINKELWPELKKTVPFGTMPILEVDGRRLGQSASICRYLAKEHGLAGENAWEAAVIDSTAEIITEIREKLVGVQKTPEEKKQAAVTEYKETTLPGLLRKLEDFIMVNSESKGESGFLVGDKVSWADLHLVAVLDSVQALIFQGSDEFFKDAPKLKTLFKRTSDLDKVKDWKEKRPQTWR